MLPQQVCPVASSAKPEAYNLALQPSQRSETHCLLTLVRTSSPHVAFDCGEDVVALLFFSPILSTFTQDIITPPCSTLRNTLTLVHLALPHPASLHLCKECLHLFQAIPPSSHTATWECSSQRSKTPSRSYSHAFEACYNFFLWMRSVGLNLCASLWPCAFVLILVLCPPL